MLELTMPGLLAKIADYFSSDHALNEFPFTTPRYLKRVPVKCRRGVKPKLEHMAPHAAYRSRMGRTLDAEEARALALAIKKSKKQ